MAASWSKSDLELTINKWNEGCSASEIARTLKNKSRNAVISKLFRLSEACDPRLKRPMGTRTQRPRIWTDKDLLDFMAMIAPLDKSRPWSDDQIADYFKTPRAEIVRKRKELAKHIDK